MSRYDYSGKNTNEISFPLGGIGSGCIGLAGNGRLIDWEIFNRPSKGSINGFSHFAIKAEQGGQVLDARVLNGDLHAPYQGNAEGVWGGGVGFGPAREYMAGAPHFKSVRFRGRFPTAELTFKDAAKFPGQVKMTAFNPFIPLNDKDSSIPAAFFEIEAANPTDKAIDYTIAATLANPLDKRSINTVSKAGAVRRLHLTTDEYDPADLAYGDLTLATDAEDVSWQQHWFVGHPLMPLEVFWREFTTPGPFANRSYPKETVAARVPGLLAARVRVGPGKSKTVRFVITWNFPNCTNYWNTHDVERAKAAGISPNWRNYYATIWKDSKRSAQYCMKNWDRLYGQTVAFRDALFASTLPAAAIEAVSANLSTLKSPTVLRLQDGTVYGFEGCRATVGCCPGSCTHVWNYTQAMPFLFPKLERRMREADFEHNQSDDGHMPYRGAFPPLGLKAERRQFAADGLLGGVMRIYRDWKICGDDEWLRRMWPYAKKAVEFAWAPTNEDKWDLEKTGVLQGRQHHTLDADLFGPNSWCTGFYLGALKAGAEMAEYVGEPETAAEYREIFARGKAWVDEHLFNGEYYHQLVDLKDPSIPYRNEEFGEVKYQIAEGCEIDQVLAQWHANIYGLGEIFDPKQTRKALKSLFKYNYRPEMREYFNSCRIYALNDDSGLVIAHWPEHVYRPRLPILYAGETQNGYEWAACIQMIQAGLVKEGMTCVRAIRDRYDGERRNPWNEFECGGNYARSMATYSLLNTFAGFQFNMPAGEIGFDPIRTKKGKFRCFWSLETGWGEFVLVVTAAEVRVMVGRLKVKVLDLPFAVGKKNKIKAVECNGKPVKCKVDRGRIRFARPVTIREGQALRVTLGK